MGNDSIVGSVPASTTDPTPAGAAQPAAAVSPGTGDTTADPQSQASQYPQIVNGGSAAAAQLPGATQSTIITPAGAGATTSATDPSGNGQAAETGSTETGSPLEAIWSWLKPSAWAVAGAVLFIAFVFGVIRPQDSTSDSPIDQNAAHAWNTTIERLGIKPLYPPQEDFYVGDVFLTVSPADNMTKRIGDYPANVFDGKAVKVGRIEIPLSSIATERFKYQKALAETPGANQTTAKVTPTMLHMRQQIRAPEDPVPLSMVSFPGITIDQTVGATASWKNLWSGRWTTAKEVVSIPAAETYSMSTTEALFELQNFCNAVQTAIYCRDEDARQILQYTLGKEVNAVVNKQYVFQLNVLVATQVYLTDTFNILRSNDDEWQASLGKPTLRPAVQKPPGAAAETVNEADVDADNQAGGEVNGSYHDTYKSKQELDRTFDRPIAFGFKSVAFALPLSTPTENETR